MDYSEHVTNSIHKNNPSGGRIDIQLVIAMTIYCSLTHNTLSVHMTYLKWFLKRTLLEFFKEMFSL